MDSFIRGGKKGPKQDREGRRSLTWAGVVHLSDKRIARSLRLLRQVSGLFH